MQFASNPEKIVSPSAKTIASEGNPLGGRVCVAVIHPPVVEKILADQIDFLTTQLRSAALPPVCGWGTWA